VRLSATDAWLVRRLLGGASLNGELAAASSGLRRTVDHLAGLNVHQRLVGWEAVLASLPASQAESVVQALTSVDPAQPMPEDEPARFATLVDVQRVSSGTRWTWEGWIPGARVCGLAAQEGCGKTRTLMDLCRRIYHAEDWPDGQRATLPAGTRTVWLCADGQQDEMAETAAAFGLPLEAVVLPSGPEDPFGADSLDDADCLESLRNAIETVRPGLVIVDSLTFATTRDLTRQDEVATLRDPLLSLAQEFSVSILLAMHVNKEGVAFGRRIRGLTRTLLHLREPDPEGQAGRLRLWVEKSYSAKPPALGVTLGPSGNTYDHTPPQDPPPSSGKGGRPPAARLEAERFIQAALTQLNDQRTAALRKAWEEQGGSVGAFYDARDAMVKDGRVVEEGRPKVLHLVREPDEEDEAF
jgi:hypothetical protein